MDVVDDDKVEVEVGLDKGVGFIFTYFLDELCGEFFGGDVANFFVGEVLLYVVGDGLYEVGFAEASVAVDHEGVERGFARFVGYAFCGCTGDLVAVAFDEVCKGEEGVKVHGGRERVVVGGLFSDFFWGGDGACGFFLWVELVGKSTFGADFLAYYVL